jgi:hypothetical protein
LTRADSRRRAAYLAAVLAGSFTMAGLGSSPVYAEEGSVPAPCPASQSLPAELPLVAADGVVTPGAVLDGVRAGDVFEGHTILQTWWLVNSRPNGSHADTYTVRKQDMGSAVSQVAIFTQPAQCPSGGVLFGASPGVFVKAATTVTTSVAKPTKGEGAVVRVRVRAPGLDSPAGTVTVSWGKKKGKSKSVSLAPNDEGVIRLRLPVFPKGSLVTVKATFKDVTGNALDQIAKAVKYSSKG